MHAPAPPAPSPKLWRDLAIWIVVCLAASALGYLASREAPEFYARLSLPGWAPPAAVFGPVWTLLYLLMGLAAGLVWQQRRQQPVGAAIALFLVQLGLNALWSWLFFAWHWGLAAFVDILLLWLGIAATFLLFWRLRRSAAWLLLPYWLWVSFAAVLCGTVWRMNPALLG